MESAASNTRSLVEWMCELIQLVFRRCLEIFFERDSDSDEYEYESTFKAGQTQTAQQLSLLETPPENPNPKVASQPLIAVRSLRRYPMIHRTRCPQSYLTLKAQGMCLCTCHYCFGF